MLYKFIRMIRALPRSLQTRAIGELNEVPERISEDLQTIREWLKKQPHLKVRDDDQSLICFLRGCKYRLQTVKDKIDFYYTSRTLAPEIFDNKDPLSPEIQELLNAGSLYVLPKLDFDGTRILLWNLSNCNPDTMPYLNLVKIAIMVVDLLLYEDDHIVISGAHFFIDFKNCPLKYVTQCLPSALKKQIHLTEKGIPIRIKKFSIVNCPTMFEFFHQLLKTFLSGKLSTRVRTYSDLNQYASENPTDVLPEEYGGTNGSLKTLKKELKKKLESHRERFLQDIEYKSDESLRLGEARTTSNMFGLEGSFRKLQLD